MNVTCPNCASIYRVDPAKVPETGVRARCAVCSAVFAVRRETEQSPPAAKAPPRAAPARTEPAPKAEPLIPQPAAKAEPARVEPSRPEPARAAAPIATPAAPRPVPPAPASSPPRPAAPPRPATPRASPPAPASAPSTAARPAAPAGPVSAKPSAPPAAAPSPAARPASGSRPANPFLSQDPALKARRLARALISDMVVYHPGKRQEGLRDGNLKELFEEEIKKSWEEYAEQVGRDVAESTPYFREALNEILASGRQIF
jgi:predicted Zn finger-like uncharacterized protein